MSEEKYMDEFARNEQENVAGSRSHWDIHLANELGIPTTRKSWKSDDRVVVSDPNANRKPSKLDMVPWREYSDTVLPRWKIDIIERQQAISNQPTAPSYSDILKQLAEQALANNKKSRSI
ncbi:hypothetical protein LGN04_02030 [Burkholderia multivorans]|uniref:hypothetical protein n=1 Tax=Burkholderiaceae TaxID=119060 RepID=UPI0012E854B1|nr:MULTISPECIES: hypothetical protein [Burkholderiaceae]MBU9434122.1 hypothetical protein [Burkholderia multivorans]MCA8452696.1 hypothetical protein [Burkholderia multivorans]MDN8018126.1 hypothetical protein [Burkholderia multivorans]